MPVEEANVNEAKLTNARAGALEFDDGSILALPASVSVKPFAGGAVLVWDLDGIGRAARVAAGRKKSDCAGIVRYVSGE